MGTLCLCVGVWESVDRCVMCLCKEKSKHFASYKLKPQLNKLYAGTEIILACF